MITVFSTETNLTAAVKTGHSPWLVHVSVDEMGSGGYRSRWKRSTYGFRAMFDALYTARKQLFTVYGSQRFSDLWWKVDDEACQRGITDWSAVMRSVEMCRMGLLVALHGKHNPINWDMRYERSVIVEPSKAQWV